MTELVLVKAADCRPLRAEVLHPGRDAAACVYDDDDDERTLHFAVKKGKRVLGVLTLRHDERDGLGSEVWRVWGVAVSGSARRQGLGRQLLLAAMAVAERRGGGVWCQAPDESSAFFEAHGFRALRPPETGDDGVPRVTLTWKPKKR
ncbi:MAG: GNAT family N-acetyltransferase [Planctomycetes bacterium]|nr:GNAT family N-acetyltransferase [Planctomycetota bacterium]